MLGTIFLVNKSGIDLEEPTTLQTVRTAYVAVKILEIIINAFIFTTLKKRQQKQDDYTTKKKYFPGPPNPFNPEPKYEAEPMTVSQHEQAKMNQVHGTQHTLVSNIRLLRRLRAKLYWCDIPLNILEILRLAYIILLSHQSFQQVVMGLVIMGFLHFKMGIVQPLVYLSVFCSFTLSEQEFFHARTDDTVDFVSN